jgi:hypothetical protein
VELDISNFIVGIAQEPTATRHDLVFFWKAARKGPSAVETHFLISTIFREEAGLFSSSFLTKKLLNQFF